MVYSNRIVYVWSCTSHTSSHPHSSGPCLSITKENKIRWPLYCVYSVARVSLAWQFDKGAYMRSHLHWQNTSTSIYLYTSIYTSICILLYSYASIRIYMQAQHLAQTRHTIRHTRHTMMYIRHTIMQARHPTHRAHHQTHQAHHQTHLARHHTHQAYYQAHLAHHLHNRVLLSFNRFYIRW